MECQFYIITNKTFAVFFTENFNNIINSQLFIFMLESSKTFFKQEPQVGL